MKKTIFITVLALAAAISCTKSDIVDTKFEKEAIGFENYLGRDAQTKGDNASVSSIATGGGIGLYGYYTGDPANGGWEEGMAANLLTDEHLTSTDNGVNWTYTNKAYWTNNSDEYTFFAYAPFGKATASQTSGQNPQISYTLPETLTNQVDLVYSNNNINITKRASVGLEFKHALARLSVTAKAVEYTDGLTFTVTDIAISGRFNTKGTFDLAKGEWTSKTTPATKPYDLTATTGQLLTTTAYNFSENEKNYMMMIPTEFSATDKATLTVTYTMKYKGEVSKPVSKSVEITTPFEQGKAYTIDLTFQRDETNAITFNVTSVGGWETGSSQTPTING